MEGLSIKIYEGEKLKGYNEAYANYGIKARASKSCKTAILDKFMSTHAFTDANKKKVGTAKELVVIWINR